MLTPEEEKWLKRMQRALKACPSDDIGFYTVGDKNVSLYRIPEGDFVDVEYSDFCCAVQDAECGLGEMYFPNQVHSTAG